MKQKEKETPKLNRYREAFIQKMSMLLYKIGGKPCDIDEAVIVLEEDLPTEFNPLIHWNFEPIYTFKKTDHTKKTESYQYHPLYEHNGTLLYDISEQGGNGITTSSVGYELWLLDNMQLAVVAICDVDVNVGAARENITYRYKVKNGIYKLRDDFDKMDFVQGIIEDAQRKVYGYIDYCDMCHSCEKCTEFGACPLLRESEDM